MFSGTEVTDLLRDKGFKATPQRLAIYEALASTTEHPNADMLYQKLTPKYPTMSLATVYKTLDILQDARHPLHGRPRAGTQCRRRRIPLRREHVEPPARPLHRLRPR